MNRREQWACWEALTDAIARTPPMAIPKRATLSAFAKLTAELGDDALRRLDERIARERAYDLTAMYALRDAKKEAGIAA